MALKWSVVGEKTVATAGTAVQVSTADTAVYDILFQAPSGNTGAVYIGLSDVDSTTYIVTLAKGESWATSGSIGGPSAGQFILSDYWVDAATNGDKVNIAYIKNR